MYMFFVSLKESKITIEFNRDKKKTMENQSKSDKALENDEAELKNEQGVKTDSGTKKESTGVDHHDYVPKHSSHGRSNSRTFGPDHEPGTIR